MAKFLRWGIISCASASHEPSSWGSPWRTTGSRSAPSRRSGARPTSGPWAFSRQLLLHVVRCPVNPPGRFVLSPVLHLRREQHVPLLPGLERHPQGVPIINSVNLDRHPREPFLQRLLDHLELLGLVGVHGSVPTWPRSSSPSGGARASGAAAPDGRPSPGR